MDGLLKCRRHDVLVGDTVGRVGQSGSNVLGGQPWIGIQEVLHRGTFRQFTQKKFHRDARTANHGLAQHHTRIDLYTRGHPLSRPQCSTAALQAAKGPCPNIAIHDEKEGRSPLQRGSLRRAVLGRPLIARRLHLPRRGWCLYRGLSLSSPLPFAQPAGLPCRGIACQQSSSPFFFRPCRFRPVGEPLTPSQCLNCKLEHLEHGGIDARGGMQCSQSEVQGDIYGIACNPTRDRPGMGIMAVEDTAADPLPVLWTAMP
jgi:hypothetical protein